jgi:hypothetical protein
MPISDPFDPQALRLTETDSIPLRKSPSTKLPRHRPGGAFLKGPIPWTWLEQAGRLPGKALHVAVLLWKEAGCRKSPTIRFCLAHAAGLRMSPDTARRGLRSLKAAGLVTVRHLAGRCCEVTLLEARDGPPTD